MGSKQKLLTELWDVASRFDFNSVVDLFSGSGIVSYMFKAQGKQVISNDYMAMSATFTKVIVENQNTTLPLREAKALLEDCQTDDFVSDTFKGLYYTDEGNHLIDVLRTRIKTIENPYRKAIAMTALIRACTKKATRHLHLHRTPVRRWPQGFDEDPCGAVPRIRRSGEQRNLRQPSAKRVHSRGCLDAGGKPS